MSDTAELYAETAQHLDSVARGMRERYGKISAAVAQCDDYINNPLTTEAGKDFWQKIRARLVAVE